MTDIPIKTTTTQLDSGRYLTRLEGIPNVTAEADTEEKAVDLAIKGLGLLFGVFTPEKKVRVLHDIIPN